jgi:sigma-B regulation protein RsbU (phosphoserine phosphatase)
MEAAMDQQILGRVPLFADLPDNELGYLVQALRRTSATPGTILFSEGDRGDRLFIILDGEIEILQALGTPDERLIGVRGPGEFVGEMSFFARDGRRMAAGRARSPVQLLEMTRADFDALLHRQPTLAYELVRVLSVRLAEAAEQTIQDLRARNEQLTRVYQKLERAQAALIEKEKLEHELNVARQIQERMLPRALPTLEGFAFGARMVPARVVSGDFFDFVGLGPARVGIAIGDVCGHGLPAALLMALTRSVLRVEASRGAPPDEVLRRVNLHLLDAGDGGTFVTAIYGVLEREARTFTYARAGHDLPIILDAAGAPILTPFDWGHPLGIDPRVSLDVQQVAVPPGGLLVLHTDGITEAMSEDGTLFEAHRLHAALRERAHLAPQPLVDALVALLEGYRGAAPQHDDATLVVARAPSA